MGLTSNDPDALEATQGQADIVFGGSAASNLATGVVEFPQPSGGGKYRVVITNISAIFTIKVGAPDVPQQCLQILSTLINTSTNTNSFVYSCLPFTQGQTVNGNTYYYLNQSVHMFQDLAIDFPQVSVVNLTTTIPPYAFPNSNGSLYVSMEGYLVKTD